MKDGMKFLIVPPISLYMNDFTIEKTLNMFLKLKKHIIALVEKEASVQPH
jgi:hypothetical protein